MKYLARWFYAKIVGILYSNISIKITETESPKAFGALRNSLPKLII
jgi:hypothetical protein